MAIQGLIFDCDGTLLDTMPFWRNLGTQYLLGKGVPKSDIPDQFYETLSAMTNEEIAQFYAERFGVNVSPEELMAEVYVMLEDEYRDRAMPKPGVLAFLKSHTHMPMCVATATERYLVEMALERLDMRKYFQFVLTTWDIGVGKEAPDIYLEAARRLGYAPENLLVFEDALYAARTAKAAGFPVAGMADRTALADAPELQRICDVYVQQMPDIQLPGI